MHFLARLVADIEAAGDDDLHFVVRVLVHERSPGFEAVETGGNGRLVVRAVHISVYKADVRGMKRYLVAISPRNAFSFAMQGIVFANSVDAFGKCVIARASLEPILTGGGGGGEGEREVVLVVEALRYEWRDSR